MRGLLATSILCASLIGGAHAAAPAGQSEGISEFYAGHAALQQADANGAIAHFSKALQIGKLDPTQIAYIHYYRAIAYQRIDKHQSAIDDYTQALSYNVLPQRVQAALHYNRAIALDHLANFDRAIKDYSSAISLKQDYAEAYMNRGNAYRKLGDNDQALRDYIASANYGNPIKHLPYYGQGLVYEAKGDKENAFKAFQTALALSPDFEPARLKVQAFQAAGMKPTMTSTVASAPGTTPPMGGLSSTAPQTRVAMTGTGTTGATAFTGMGGTPASDVGSMSAPSAAKPTVATPAPKPVGTSAAIAGTPHPSPASWSDPSAPGRPAASSSSSKPVTTALNTEPAGSHTSIPQTSISPSPASISPGAPATTRSPAPAGASSVTAGQISSIPGGSSGSAIPAVGGATKATTHIASAGEEIPAPATPSHAASGSSIGGGFLIQVAAYKDETVAQATAQDVKTKAGDLLNDTTGNIQRADLGEKGVYYRVQYGPFASRGAASERCSSLKSRGLACIVVAPSRG